MGETTQILHRRIRHWKTTIAGIATIVAPVLVILFPDYAAKITLIGSACTGWGLISAPDASNLKPKPPGEVLEPPAAGWVPPLDTRGR